MFCSPIIDNFWAIHDELAFEASLLFIIAIIDRYYSIYYDKQLRNLAFLDGEVYTRDLFSSNTFRFYNFLQISGYVFLSLHDELLKTNIL